MGGGPRGVYAPAVRWTSLGHAAWLVEAGELRLLFDPVLEETHHGGVFGVVPPRTIDVERLAPDFVLISHRHTDHFDLPSLRALARLDPESVVVTPDPVVARAARRLGFSTVRELGVGHHVALDGVELFTTPSTAPLEWGAMVATPEGIAWNQVDSVLPDVAAVTSTLGDAGRAFGRREPLALALVRWQPMLEIAAQTGTALGFPYGYYRQNLEQIAAIGAATVVPSAAGARHLPPYDAMDRLVYPVSEARVLRDLARRLPDATIHAPTIGATYVVAGGTATVERAREPVVVVEPAAETRLYAPLAVPPVCDPDLNGLGRVVVEERVDRWVHEVLAPGMASVRAARGLSLCLGVALPGGGTLEFTLRDGAVERRRDEDWDALVEVSGSHLLGVVDGRRNWGDVLLGGLLRGATRAYDVDDRRGLVARPLGVIFLYHVLPYDQVFERWVDHELARLVG